MPCDTANMVDDYNLVLLVVRLVVEQQKRLLESSFIYQGHRGNLAVLFSLRDKS